MHRLFSLTIFLLAVFLILAGCSKEGESGNSSTGERSAAQMAPAAWPGEDGVFEVQEQLFIILCNEIYMNYESYIGRSIRLEGIYQEGENELTGEPVYMVMRYGPGCCGNDGIAGFTVVYDTEEITPPEPEAWVEANGTLELLDDDGRLYLVLSLTSIEVKEARGLEYVIH